MNQYKRNNQLFPNLVKVNYPDQSNYRINKCSGSARLVIAECGEDNYVAPVGIESIESGMTLEYGLRCLDNALALLPKKNEKDDSADFNKLHSSILLTGAFISLKLKKFSKAAELATKCKQLDATKSSALLAELYLVSRTMTLSL